MPHLLYEDSTLAVKITPLDWVGHWFNLIFGWFLTLLGVVETVLSIILLMTALLGQIKEADIIQSLNTLGLGVLFLAIAFAMLSQTFPVFSARYVAKELEKQRNNSAQPAN